MRGRRVVMLCLVGLALAAAAFGGLTTFAADKTGTENADFMDGTDQADHLSGGRGDDVIKGEGQTSDVKGTEYLTTGDYDFVCSVHPQMTGTLHVTSAGTPVPRPSSGGGPTSQSAPDTQRPAVAVRLLDTRLSAVRRARALRVSVSVDEPATVRLTARAGRTTLGAATVKLTAAGTHRVALRLTAAGARLARRSARLAVVVSARAADAAGNAGRARAARTLRR